MPCPSLRESQQQFMNYLLDQQQLEIEQQIVSSPNRPARTRLFYYANGYRLRLRETLMGEYERLHGYLGDDYFEQLVQLYIDRYPSQYPSLRDFGQHMLELVSTTEPFSQWPEVAELVGIEQAFQHSFDSANAVPIEWQSLVQLEPEQWAGLALEFHPSLQLLPLQRNSFAIWQALANEQTPPPCEAAEACWMVWRKDLISQYRSLSAAEVTALRIMQNGAGFAELCEELMPILGEEQTPLQAIGFLQQWVGDQLVVGLNPDGS